MQSIGRVVGTVILLALVGLGPAAAEEVSITGFDDFALGDVVDIASFTVMSREGKGPSAITRVLLDEPAIRLTSGTARCMVAGSVVGGRLEGILITNFEWARDETDFNKQLFVNDLIALLLAKYEGLEVKDKRPEGSTNIFIEDGDANRIWLGWVLPHLNVEYTTATCRAADRTAVEGELEESAGKF